MSGKFLTTRHGNSTRSQRTFRRPRGILFGERHRQLVDTTFPVGLRNHDLGQYHVVASP